MKKSTGLDSIVNKLATPIVSISLSKISVKAGVFPTESELACFVAPIFKSGCKSELSNYRPISVLSSVARVFERLIFSQLSEYLQENNFFTKYQQGFTQQLRQC